MKDLKTLLEVSLMDINGTIEDGNKYNDVDLEMLMNAKSESEFNLLYNLLKDKIVSNEKRPEIGTNPSGHKFIKTNPGKFYIVFYNYKDYNKKESPAIIFGNENTVSTRWNVNSNKLNTSWSSIDFSHLYNGMYKYEIRQLPKEWSTQVTKLIKKSNYK